MAIYRNNGSANAVRAMAVMFPAVHALLGEDDFYPLARLHWLAQPPQRGDWSQYGAGFGDWIADVNPGGILDSLPFLPDLAKLDDALSRCQDAANATADLATLALLEQDPSTLCMRLHPSLTILEIGYDVLEFRNAVLAGEPLAPPICSPTHAMIARESWRAKAFPVSGAVAAFVASCLANNSLLQAHDAATAIDPEFDVSAWLTQAIPAQWLLRIERIELIELI
jgi:hypothetical protein